MIYFLQRLRTIVLYSLALCLLLPAAAQAQQFETGYFSLELPSGWSIIEEGDVLIGNAPGDDTVFNITLTAVEELNLEKQVKEQAEGNSVKKIGPGYAYEDETGARYWIFGDQYAFGEFRTIQSSDELPGIIASLKATGHAPLGAAEVLKAANAPDVIAWLQFK